ncbi:MAG: esterase-like activity of phytase family protein [Rhodobiaceae bacterium]|nr:esterase-like activity of phytase family protein [Rhodobiaceae bacterium]MCC0016680.1 esterase-like activity of phytase family protein [Rhodobiaceae bacterium]MCC0054470.1 esterase-like activity of phytase family protein [Rhodobiaceae bacterium]
MKHTGHHALAAAIAAVLMCVPARAETLSVSPTPLSAFAPLDPARTRFGRLVFLAGSELAPDSRRFGGISSLDVSPDGTGLTAVTDLGDWITARIETLPDGALTLAGIEIERMRDGDGEPMASKQWSDAEGISPVPGRPGVYQVSFERRNRIWQYDIGRGGLAARPRDVPVPDGIRGLPDNKGVEALAVLPQDSPLGAATIAFAENPVDGYLEGFIVGGRALGRFRVRAYEDFDVTDAALDPAGNIVILERYFSILTGPKMALHRIRVADIADGATIYPELLMDADVAVEIDNMEALGIHTDAQGRTILTIMSDNNFTRLQRNLLLRFELVD